MPEQDEQTETAEPVAIEVAPAEADDDKATESTKLSDADLAALCPRVEAILLSVDRPYTAGKIAEALELESTGPVKQAVAALNDFYDEHARSFRIEQLAGGFQMLTRAEYRDTVAALHRTKPDNKLSPAAMETLAIVAYKQPIMRAQIETVRGVACGEVLRSLMDKHLVKIVGRAEELGRPMLYGTTKTFLQVFGLASLKDLPKSEELNKP